MPEEIGWVQIAVRLFFTVLGGALIGINRGEHGRPAGLRTTLLVCLAASISMIQVNLLLPIHGKAPDSFVVMDLMRLPLGILSGMGFIGAGAILRKDNLVVGVTTAATLWFVTVMGLCFGGGQIGLGLIALILGLFILSALKTVEKSWKHDRNGSLTIAVGNNGPGEAEIAKIISAAGYKVSSVAVSYDGELGFREFVYSLKWRAGEDEIEPPAFLDQLASQTNTVRINWKPESQGGS